MRRASWLTSDRLAQAAVAALRLEGYKGCTLVEMNPGSGVFAQRLQQAVQPRQHILLEPAAAFQAPLQALQCKYPCVEVRRQDGFLWSTYVDLEKEGKLQGLKVDEGENKRLLFVGNLMRGHQGEQLLSQFLGCIAEQTWLQQYGRVRMLLWMNSTLARRMLARPGDRPARTRASVVAEALADTRLVVVPAGEGGDGLVESQEGDVAPHEAAALLDVRPRAWSSRGCEYEVFDYLLKNLFTCRSMGVQQAMDVAAPKGSSLLLRLPHIRPSTRVCDLQLEELLDLARAFDAWPFRPQYLWDEKIDNLERAV